MTSRRDLQCPDCPSEVLGPSGAYTNRYRVVHAETCPAWIRYQKRLPGYTAMPSGAVVLAGEEAPPGTTVLVSNGPVSPCGLVVTHRGPYRKARAL